VTATADNTQQQTDRRQSTPINVCDDCGCNSSNGHICLGVRTPRRTR
jgi:hypothetical protein